MLLFSMIFHSFNFCLGNYKFSISSREFLWEDEGAVYVRKRFLGMLKSQCLKSQTAGLKAFYSLIHTLYLLFFLNLIQIPRNALYVVIIAFCLFVSQILMVSKAIWSNELVVKALISQFKDTELKTTRWLKG